MTTLWLEGGEQDLHLEVLPVLLCELTCRRCHSDEAVKNLQQATSSQDN